MNKMLHTAILLTVSLTISACGQPEKSLETQNADSSLSIQSTKGDKAPVIIDNTTPWFEGLASIGEAYPAFAGYDVDSTSQTITLLVAKKSGGRILSQEERGNKLGLIKQDFQRLLDVTKAMPLDLGIASSSDIKWKYRFQDVMYSLADMNQLQRAVEGSSLKWGSVSVDMMENRVAVRVADEAQTPSLHSMGQDKGIGTDGLDIVYGDLIPGGTNNVSIYNPAPGGVSILITATATATTGTGCTLGLPVVVNGITGFLTAAHCAQPIGTDTDLYIKQGGTSIGQEQNDPANITMPDGSKQREADVVFFKSYSNYSQGIISKSSGIVGSHTTMRDAAGSELYYRVANTVLRPGISVALENLGSTAGYRKATTTANLNVTTNFSGTNPPVVNRGMVEVYSADKVVGAGCQGDSGSPWYSVNADGTTATFYGIFSGLSDDFVHTSGKRCGYYAYFSPVEQIEKAFGAGNVNYKN
jgi:hypothetical protein